MLDHRNHYQAGGDSSYPYIRAGKDEGYEKLLIGSGPVTPGTIVVMGFTDGASGFNAGAVDGPGSPMRTVQLPDSGAGSVDPRIALYGCVTGTEPSVAVGQTCKVYSAYKTLPARTQVPIAGFGPGVGLMHDVSNDGTLVLWDGTSKCIAITAQKVNAPSSAGEQTIIVHFNGIEGFG